MNEIKVSLTISLQGSVMFSKEECLKTTQKVTRKKNKSFKKQARIQEEDLSKMDKNTLRVIDKRGKHPEMITFYTRKSRPAKQTINISKDSYDYMTSSSCPEWSKVGAWIQMSKVKRLEAHLQRLAEHLGGNVLSYKVFED